MTSGSLFTQDYLARGVCATSAWQAVQTRLADVRAKLIAIHETVANPAGEVEAQIEKRIIQPVLDALGWDGLYAVQTRLDIKGRRNVPDYLFFATAEDRAAADPLPQARQSHHGIMVGDAKAWAIDLDKRGGGAGQDEAPTGQMLRYMDAASAASDRHILWGLLTNGRVWRLYFQDARSRLDDYFEIDLAWALQRPGAQGSLDLLPPSASEALDAEDRAARSPDHALALFILFFERQAFLPGTDGRTRHRLAMDEGRDWEARIRGNLSEVVFAEVFPGLIRAIATADPQARPTDPAYLADCREAALTALYRLLFALYAEDRDLLPKRSKEFDDYALASLRDHVALRVDAPDAFSSRVGPLWARARALFRLIDKGDPDLGLPPYNGGLFSLARSPLLERVELSDARFAPLLDLLSRVEGKRVNYRDLTVRELGSIYERLLEHEPVADSEAPDGIAVRPNVFARKGSGSYYTPEVLVKLIIERTLTPLAEDADARFHTALAALNPKAAPETVRAELDLHDPARAILSLKVVDPAMGSGHFLVDLIDWLADRAFTAMGEAEKWARDAGFDAWHSPVADDILALHDAVRAEADAAGWHVPDTQLTDVSLIKRIVLKRCVYGVDKNPMAVELAKVALWLHTFTAGAPLSFLDHHLRCGDSLFGEWVNEVLPQVEAYERKKKSEHTADLFLGQAVNSAIGAEAPMRRIESSSDTRLQEVDESRIAFDDVQAATAPLKAFLDVWHGLKWLKLEPEDRAAVRAWLDGQFGDPLSIALHGGHTMQAPAELTRTDGQIDLIQVETAPEQLSLLPGQASARAYLRARRLIDRARALAAEQQFLHWQVAFPGVWTGWRTARQGGFDAVIGNPPWDRMKMQEVEWFAERAPAVARQSRAADRKAAIEALAEANDPLAADYARARDTAETAMRVARDGGAYPLLSRGDINLYSLFVERSQTLLNPDGAAGVLVPSTIMSGKDSAEFLEKAFVEKRISAALEFFNRKADGNLWFADVYWRFRFCVLIVGGAKATTQIPAFTFFYRGSTPPSADDMVRLDETTIRALSPDFFALPMFADEYDAKLATKLSGDAGLGRFGDLGLHYHTMFHMAGDSGLFHTLDELSKSTAYPIGLGQWTDRTLTYDRLFEGKMVQAFDHRAASVVSADDKTFRTADAEATSAADHVDPGFVATPRFYVSALESRWRNSRSWALALKDITSVTNTRTCIAAIIPRVGAGHSLPIFVDENTEVDVVLGAAGNLNSIPFDYLCRFRVQTNHLTLGILRSLTVIPPAAYARAFGNKTAADIVRDHVLRLSYTAHDLAPFARDLGHVDSDGNVLPPFAWDEDARRLLRARLDALYFILYGLTEPDDVRHVLSTFPIVRRKDIDAHGVYLTERLVLWFIKALLAGDPDRDPPLASLLKPD